ncbi:baseplate assembly protein [Buttiauxella sp. 3AFRM03]|uniref:baseplate assembly protein n=1 Tax=Buttiauxella sp. 3AFRM03 TaxID=2479367 RepID=UPI000EF78D2B|nr:baseplate J/gp47 family protein [Buttiauxella sp. 3AFRM03]AYN30008.1 baseplate assembly protein [Buttiauxella sp. 3AFRM03]
MSQTIDLSQLPPPAVIEMPEFEMLKQERLAELQGLDPVFNALLESDPAIKLLEILVYREMVGVQRFNSGIWAVLLAYAMGADLDQLGANYDVARREITPPDNTVIPPVPAVMESDDEFRYRIQISWHALNTAGSNKAYEYHTLSADGDVLDAIAYGPPQTQPGYVDVYVLSRTGNGVPPQSLLDTVTAALNAEFVRPLTDFVTVRPATIIDYQIVATIYTDAGPSSDVVMENAEAAAWRFAEQQHRFDNRVDIGGVYRALRQPGTTHVELTSPAADLIPVTGQVFHCTDVILTRGDNV